MAQVFLLSLATDVAIRSIAWSRTSIKAAVENAEKRGQLISTARNRSDANVFADVGYDFSIIA